MISMQGVSSFKTATCRFFITQTEVNNMAIIAPAGFWFKDGKVGVKDSVSISFYGLPILFAIYASNYCFQECLKNIFKRDVFIL